ncbi:MAG: DUF3822 family protein [Bacteroidales bacterium]|nr:DUF3822 family protein [Bacteroidales bacterium]
MPDVSLVESSLKNYYNQTEISIQVSLSGFSFCIYSQADKTIRAFRNYCYTNIILQEDLLNSTGDVLKKDELLRLPHKKVNVIYVGRSSTILPDEYFEPSMLKHIMEFNQPVGELDEIHYKKLPFNSVRLVHTVPTYFAGIMLDKFSDAQFYNQASPLLDLAYRQRAELSEKSVIINLNKEFFDIIVLIDGEIKLYNTFLYVNSTDLLYFILFVCKQLSVNTEEAFFYISGEECNNTTLTNELRNFLKKLEFIKNVPVIQFGNLFGKLNKSQFITLFNLSNCES